MRFICHGRSEPELNLALEEILLTTNHDDVFMLWQNSPSVIIGRNQNAHCEVDREYIQDHDIKVIRRISGGGAVYHDWGNLNFSFITSARKPIQDCIRPLLESLIEFNLPALWSGRNDIVIYGKKISGTAQCLMNNRRLFHGSILINSNLDMFDCILTPPTEKLARHCVNSVRSRIGNILDFLNGFYTAPEFTLALKQKLMKYFDQPYCSEISTLEWDVAVKLAEHKYRRPEWTWDMQTLNRDETIYEL